MKRAFDFLAAAVGLIVLAIPLAVLWLLVRLTSPGPGLYWSQRVGKGSALFPMVTGVSPVASGRFVLGWRRLRG